MRQKRTVIQRGLVLVRMSLHLQRQGLIFVPHRFFSAKRFLYGGRAREAVDSANIMYNGLAVPPISDQGREDNLANLVLFTLCDLQFGGTITFSERWFWQQGWRSVAILLFLPCCLRRRARSRLQVDLKAVTLYGCWSLCLA